MFPPFRHELVVEVVVTGKLHRSLYPSMEPDFRLRELTHAQPDHLLSPFNIVP